jgi:hypothetical protein
MFQHQAEECWKRAKMTQQRHLIVKAQRILDVFTLDEVTPFIFSQFTLLGVSKPLTLEAA